MSSRALSSPAGAARKKRMNDCTGGPQHRHPLSNLDRHSLLYHHYIYLCSSLSRRMLSSIRIIIIIIIIISTRIVVCLSLSLLGSIAVIIRHDRRPQPTINLNVLHTTQTSRAQVPNRVMKNPFGRRMNRSSSTSNDANTSNGNSKDDMELNPGATHDSEGTDNHHHHHHHHNNNNNNKTTNGSTANNSNNNHQETDVWDVVIIGAGWAGIGAGRYLWDQHSFSKKTPPNVCILEAAPQIGGRSQTLVLPATSDHDACMVEVGSQWIHGLDRRRNRIYQLALQHKDQQLFKLQYDRGDDDWLHGKPAIWRDTISTQNADDNGNPKRQTRTQRMDTKTIQELERKLTQGKHGFYPYLHKYPRKQQKKWNAQQRKNKKQQSTNDSSTNPNSNDINTINNKPPSVSVQHVLDEHARIQNLSPEDQRFLQYLVEMDLTLEYGASLDDIDATFWDHDWEYKGGDLHFGLVQQPYHQQQHHDAQQRSSTSTFTTNQSAATPWAGYSALIEKYAAPIRDQIRCHCLVTSIDYSDKDSSLVVIEYLQPYDNNHSDNNISNINNNNNNNNNNDSIGEEPEIGAQPSSSSLSSSSPPPRVHRILARTVLCTVPLGVLKAEQIKFTPPLPQPKRLAIERLGMGTYNKVVLIWKPEQRKQLPWLFSLEESLSKRQQSSNASKSRKANNNDKNDESEEQGKATHRMWMQRVNLPREPLGPWTVCYNAHTHHQGPKSPAMLYFFLGGCVAQQVERLSDKEIQEQAMESLREWFDDAHIPNPHNIIVTRWDQDPLACGSYSYYQVGSSPKDRQELTKPIEQKVFFAGEANHVQYYATTHGALMTGHDAAKLIWNSLGRMQRRQKSSKRRSKR